MAGQIIKQPNGKYCIFSSIVDDIVHYNMTPEEIIEVWVEEYKVEIIEKVNKIITELNEDRKPYHQFTNTYEEMLNIIEGVHGEGYTHDIKIIMENKSEDDMKSENEITSDKFEKFLDEFFEMMTISKPLASTQDSMLHAIEFGYRKAISEGKNTVKSQTLLPNNPNILGKFIVNYNEKTKELEITVNDFVQNYMEILPKSDNGIVLRTRLREF